MNNERVNGIRARWESMTLSDVDLHHEVLHLDSAARIFVAESHGDIDYLLAENARLQAAIEAARRLSIAASELKRLESADEDERNAKWDSAYEELYRANKAFTVATE